MKTIEELVKNVQKYNKTIIQQNFKSKKNKVSYVTIDGKPRVLKLFVPGFKNQMKNEFNILKKGLSKINIPYSYELDEQNNIIVMSYIIGENLCDIINDEQIMLDEKKRLAILLADWFFQFHTNFKTIDGFRIRGDPSLRNFIFSDRIWGVDFEESRIGKPVEDIAGMCSSILTTDPMFTSDKFEICQDFIRSYAKSASWNLTNINEEIAYALLEKIQWRPNQEKILRKFSKRIKIKGIL